MKVIALESHLRECKNVLTLGVRPNFSDYSAQDANLIRTAKKIYYPSTFYAELFDTMGKSTFPSYHTYKFVQDKIKQTALFNLFDVPHPKTRIYYGKHQQRSILDHFSFPFIAKVSRGSALGRGVFLIKNKESLDNYCQENTPAYIQEYIKTDRDIRVVIIGDKIVHAYWRIASPNEFRSNIALGGTVCLDSVPTAALDLALMTAHQCKWNNVGIDILMSQNKFYIIEANMKYGKEGFRKAGINYINLMESLIQNGEI